MDRAAARALPWCALVPGLLLAGTAQAVPAFARREGASGQMCHFRLPELNEDGHACLRRGLRASPAMRSSSGDTLHESRPAAAPAASEKASPMGAADDRHLPHHEEFTCATGLRYSNSD